jgi:hypothetical protein
MSIEVTQYVVYNAKLGWRIDQDGLLRCTTNVLKSCVMPYTVAELGSENVPAEIRNKRIVNLYVPEDEIENADSVKSLEGKPVSIDHIWQKTGNIEAVGNIAGEPSYDPVTKMLSADILITDKDAIERITTSNNKDKLIDQSAAYRNTIEWVSGVSPSGEPYDGIQRDIVYNHVALLEKGQGRAGEDVRILNKDRSTKVSEFTLVKVGRTSIRVMNEDVDKLENALDDKDKEMDDKDQETKNTTDERLAKAKEVSEKDVAELKKMKNSNDELKGQVEALKTQLENASSLTVMKNAVNEALKQRKEATEILNSLEAKKECVEKVEDLMGHDLRKHVVSEFRSMNGKPELSEDESSEAMVCGMFTALKDTASLLGNKKTVSGAKMFETTNSGSEAPTGDLHSQEAMLQRKVNSQKRLAEHFKR